MKDLGIDEVSIRRGHRYLNTDVDLLTGQVERLVPFFKRLKRFGVRLKAVAMDM